MQKRTNPPPVDRRQLVLDAIQRGCHTWDEIAASTKLNDNQLGLIFSELLTQKRVKAEYLNGERRYQLLKVNILVGRPRKVEQE